MPETIDVAWLGSRLRRRRAEKGLTLRDAAAATGISVPTLSRIERGAANDIEGGTLVSLCEWLGISVENLRPRRGPVTRGGGSVEGTPEIVELYLRADKNLDKETAGALAKMFRVAYDLTVKKRA